MKIRKKDAKSVFRLEIKSEDETWINGFKWNFDLWINYERKQVQIN